MKNRIDLTCMKGPLTFKILWIIGRKPCTGKDIFDEIEKRRGKRPSCGTVYPVLKSFRECGFVNHKGDLYELTEKGKKELKNACEILSRIFYDFEDIRNFAKE